MDTTPKNTLVVDFSVLPVRVNAAEVHKFLVNNIQLDITKVKNLQLHSIRKQVFIEFGSMDTAEALAASHNLKHSIQVEAKKFLIPVFMEDTSTNVRIHDLPPGMPNAIVAEHMKQYGRVKSVVRELWKKYFPGTPNGVRVVRIELDKHVPSYIQIQNQMTSVSYQNQPTTCRSCSQRSHPNMKCSDAGKAKKRNNATDTAGPLQRRSNPPLHNQTNDNDDKADDDKAEPTRQTKRKRNAKETQVSDTIDMDCAVEEIETNEDTTQTDETEDWTVYHCRKLDRMLEENKKIFAKCDLVLNKK